MSAALTAAQPSLKLSRPAAASQPNAKPWAACSRRHTLAGIATAIIGGLPGASQARPALLDLPSCQEFKSTASGISYCEVREGGGDSPLAGDLIEVDYTARAVATGKVYDGSTKFKFTVGNDEVIPGWEMGILGGEGLPAIKEGGVRTLLIPPRYAYGPQGDACLFGRDETCRIPPNSDVEITFRYKGLGY